MNDSAIQFYRTEQKTQPILRCNPFQLAGYSTKNYRVKREAFEIFPEIRLRREYEKKTCGHLAGLKKRLLSDGGVYDYSRL